ncbi:hypothetical protein [Aquimarina agarivorans]|uniref:hypothetical protein n=1 Tax=Aquimarina agarivorans TaxID=980584 RepID=UPI000248EA31|nr:hypothetical protein [Aquimarina agarivorans]
MSILNSINTASKQAISSSEDYIEATQDYLELKVFQQISLSFSFLIKILLIGGLCFVGATFLMIAGILKLATYIGDTSLALMYSSLIVFGISLILYLLRKKLIDSAIVKKLGKTFFQK